MIKKGESERMSHQGATSQNGPLTGLRVLEFVGLGPGPHCAMLLADLGAEVVRFDRPGGNGFPNPIMDRGRDIVTVDLKNESDCALCRRSAAKADVLIEGYRPGVMERLGLGPTDLLRENPRLVYARLTGWGQEGPLAPRAGHDINYIAVAGALAHVRPVDGLPIPPLNLVGDYGGGSLFAAFGIMAALWERERSGQGQVIDAAIVDGTASLMSLFSGLSARGAISLDPRRNVLGGAAPFYRCYQCAEGGEISVGALEPEFYGEFIRRTGAPEVYLQGQYDTDNWAERSRGLAQIFAQKTRQEWCRIFEGTDACVAPVLTLEESFRDEHLRARGTYVVHDGVSHCAPAPRFSRTPGVIRPSRQGGELLRSWGAEE
jgi:alpha-methylacyl-CoA racemase